MKTASRASTNAMYQDGGVSQAERLIPPLLPGRLSFSGHDLEGLLAYVAQFSELVRFYRVADGDVVSDSTWNLAKHRSILIIALIAAQKIQAQYEVYSELIRLLHDETSTVARRRQALEELMSSIERMVRELDDWYTCHRRSQQRRVFQAELAASVQKLGPVLRRAANLEALLFVEGEIGQRRLAENCLPQLQAIWQSDQEGEALGEQELIQREVQDMEALLDGYGQKLIKPADVLQALAEVLWQFHKTQAALASFAHRVLDDDLRSEDDHLPEMGLLITFLRLYQHAQDELNRIPRRHLDHYYRDVLRVAYRPAAPDQAYLSFQLAKNVTAHRLPAGLEVEGGKDAQGQRIVFRTVEEQLLTPWRIEQFATLHVAGRGPGRGLRAGAVTGIYAAPRADSADGLGQQPLNPVAGWAPFGEDQGLISAAHRTMQDGRVGFAVAAAVLQLQEGRRTVELRLHCDAASIRRFREAIGRHFTAPGHTWQQGFDQLCLRAFRAQLTGPEGWLALPTQEVRLDEAAGTLTWRLLLAREQPAAVAHDAAVHGGQFQTGGLPVLQLVLNERAPQYAYSCFTELRPRKISLRVQARDVQGIQLSNQLGPLDMALPFAPFGTRARPGSYLLVGYPELFRKRLTQLSVSINWLSLPTEPGGFAEYYENYGQDIGNDSFQVAGSYLRDWRWLPDATPVRTRTLFSTAPDPYGRPGHTALLPTTELALGTAGVADFRHNQQEIPPGYRPDAATGFVRLELVEPAAGFGDELYPTLLSETLQYNARNARPKPLPRPPFVPMAQSVSLSYAAEEEFEVAALFGTGAGPQLYHLHPFAEYQPARLNLPAGAPTGPGKASAAPAAGGYTLALLPELPDEGTLYLGLSNLTPGQTINLLFEMSHLHLLSREDSLACTDGQRSNRPKIDWAYLVDDEWRPFSKGHTLRDQSLHFTEQGQVYLTLPTTLNTRHAVMPEGLYWLRATVRRHAALVSRVRAVHPQVVRAERTGSAPEQPVDFEDNLPAERLTRLVKPEPQLAKVAQPLDSSGGQRAETTEQYYVRVSERLRHRNRAVAPWDYERLVLEQFPDVYRVKCLRNDQLPARQRKPGQVVLMVLPHPLKATDAEAVRHRLPHFSPGRLKQIRKFLQPLASPHIRLEVCNPLYEVIRVRAQVRYRKEGPGGDHDFFSRQLQRDLAHFLSPWDQGSGSGNGYHRTLTGPMVLSYLNQLPYVEFTTGFSVTKMALENYQYRYFDSAGLPPAADGGDAAVSVEYVAEEQPLEETSGHRPWAVYVSAPQHDIEELPAGYDPRAAEPTGIGRMAVGGDFAIPFSFEAELTPEAAD